MPLYRVMKGMNVGKEGRPLEKKADLYSLKLEGGGIGWFPKHHIKRLECEVFNCRTYSDEDGHNYCQECVAKGKDLHEADKFAAPAPEPEGASPFAALLKLAKAHDSSKGKLVSIIETIEKFKSGEIPMDRVTIGAFCSETREILADLTPEESMYTGEDIAQKIGDILGALEGVCDARVV